MTHHLVRTWGVSFLATFGAFWTLADPLGGMDFLAEKVSTKHAIYGFIGMASALIATVIAFVHFARQDAHEAPRAVGETRLVLNYAQLARHCSKRFAVLGLTLPSFASEGMLRTYDRILTGGAKVDILLVNPFSPSLLQRSKHLYVGHERPNITGARSIRTLLEHKESLPPAMAQRFNVRVTNTLPTVACVIIDDSCHWHPYLASATGVMSPYVSEPGTAGFGQHVTAYFDDMMKSERSIEATKDAAALEAYLAADHTVSFQYSQSELKATREELML